MKKYIKPDLICRAFEHESIITGSIIPRNSVEAVEQKMFARYKLLDLDKVTIVDMGA